MKLRNAVVAVGLALIWPGVGSAQPSAVNAATRATAAAPAARGAANAQPKQRPLNQRDLTKIRPGSTLRANEPFPKPPDLRSDYERRRDEQIIIHYQRMARLDVIEKVAESIDNQRILARVEAVRRRETERFRLAMLRLREVNQAKELTGLP